MPIGFSAITKDDLTDDDRLSTLYREAIERGWWPRGEAPLLDFWALAEKSLQDDKQGTPGKLFHALVKRGERNRITAAQEQRAQERMPAGRRAELVRQARDTSRTYIVRADPTQAPDVEGNLEKPSPDDSDDQIVYQHAVLMQCFLPAKRLPDNQRSHVVHHGRTALRVEGGALAKPDAIGEFRTFPVPFGTQPRLILPAINQSALANRSRTVNLAPSTRRFMGRLGLSFDGRRGRKITEAVQAVAAAQMVLGTWETDGAPRSRFARIAKEVTFWVERDERQRSLWEPEMILTQEYYDAITEYPVPIKLSHLTALGRSPRRMDLYCWLAYRTSRIPGREAVHIQLSELHRVFAPGIASLKRFKQKFCEDITAVHEVYPDFRISIRGDLLVLHASPPPVKPRLVITIPPSQTG